MQVPAQKNSKKESKLDQNSNAGPAPKRPIWHSWSADRHKCGARLEGFWFKINLTFYDFLEIRTCPSSYSDHLANFSNIPASINRGCLSKFSRLFHAFWPPLFLASLFFSILSYIKDVMEALTLGISFCKQNILGFKELNIFFWIIKCPFTKKSTHASGS